MLLNIINGKYIRWSLELALVVAVVAGIQHWRTRDSATGTAPTLEASLIDGTRVSIGDDSGPALVHFWGTWCPICRFEQDTIESLSNDHPVVTVALASGSDRDMAAYLEENELSFPVINDDAGTISSEWGVSGVPTTFVVDTQGRIVFVTSGYTTGLGLRLRLWLASD